MSEPPKGPHWNEGHPDKEKEGFYIIWDGHWQRRVNWIDGNWVHIRGLRWWKRNGKWIRIMFPEPTHWRPDDPAWG